MRRYSYKLVHCRQSLHVEVCPLRDADLSHLIYAIFKKMLHFFTETKKPLVGISETQAGQRGGVERDTALLQLLVFIEWVSQYDILLCNVIHCAFDCIVAVSMAQL